MHSLVVGGTGMLAGVTTWLAQQGYTVSVVSRRAGRFSDEIPAGRIHAITVDYRESETLRQRIDEAVSLHGPIQLAVFWIHTDARDAFRVISEEVSRHASAPWRLFHVRGSAAHLNPEPPQVPPNCRYREVVLGFVIEGNRSRWLTHEEISGGVMDAIRKDGERTVVGTLEPWDKRPL
ncbi:short-chain dehydrogenase [Alicyclobacillus contaminans]|uniref:short-chain dehydrogenase n=1 Tax=Alicyclobacillus contaminans TaxID=392016 RepID=UPI00047E5ECE|nr:short-chain dehydrogenase [Alicyclobacillus contaminans]GMA49950.1 short-chain dehydrogenase [Alicyclobacillus contaminans]